MKEKRKEEGKRGKEGEVGSREERLGKGSKDPVRRVKRKDCGTGKRRKEREDDLGREEGK